MCVQVACAALNILYDGFYVHMYFYSDRSRFTKWTPHPSVMMDEGHYLSKPEASMYDIAIGLARSNSALFTVTQGQG